MAAGPFPSPKMFVLAATKSLWLPHSPAQVWAAPLSAPLLQSSDRLEFSKNNLTENQRNEQRERKQLNNRSACPVRVPNPKTTKVPPPLAGQASVPPRLLPALPEKTLSGKVLCPPPPPLPTSQAAVGKRKGRCSQCSKQLTLCPR